MASCDICGETAFTNTCNECGGEFCQSHMLPENHRCESVLADKADPTWFQEGDAEVTLGEPSGEEPTADADSADGGSGSTAGDQYTIDAGESDGHEETAHDRGEDGDSTVEHPTGTETPPTPSRSQEDTTGAYTVEAANRSRLSLPNSVTRMGTRLYHLASDLLRVGSILAVWIGVGLVGWLLLTDAALGVVVQAAGVVAGGFGGLYVTTR